MKRLYRIGKWTAIGFAALVVVLFAGLYAAKVVLKMTTRIESSNGISSLEQVTLGGAEQWIFIRGTDVNNPVLLFLHGGPGMPIIGMATSRQLDAELIDHFTVVHWDQRGSGKSYDPTLTMSLDQIINDGGALIDYLLDRLGQEKVYLVAHSWGTIFGAEIAYRNQEKLHAYVGISQIVDNAEKEERTYHHYLDYARRVGDDEAVERLDAIGPPPFDSLDELYGKDGCLPPTAMIKDNETAARFGLLFLGFLISPEYSWLEGIQTMRMQGMDFTIEALWDQWDSVNVAAELEAADVPEYFFEGRHDWTNPTVLVEEFYENLEDKDDVNLIIFENSAHFPMIEEKEKYQDLIINVVLKDGLND